MTTVLSTIIALCLLIAIHEFGHFWVARRCGVKVLRFSIGFGKPLLRWTDKKGTEFVLAMLPLGGYVKMLDEREGVVDSHELHQAFNRQSVIRRMLIVAAGPAINLLTAVIIFWGLFVYGQTVILPVVGEVVNGSLADEAGMRVGDQILAIDGNEIATWSDVSSNLANYIGETAKITMTVQTVSINTEQYKTQSSSPRTVEIVVKEWLRDQVENPIQAMGIIPFRPHIDAVIDTIAAGDVADVAGLKVGDRIIAVNDEQITSWIELEQIIQAHPNKPLLMKVQRENEALNLTVVPRKDIRASGKAIGLIGIEADADWPEWLKKEKKYSLIAAWGPAVDEVLSTSLQALDGIYKLITGQISLSNLHGIGTVAVVAGDSADAGFLTFLRFLAFLSITLGVLNLLPIPVLDGGHLLYFLIEMIIRRPVPEKIQMIGFQIGLLIILGIMFLALYNDIIRFWPH